jgi:hypothetical protein
MRLRALLALVAALAVTLAGAGVAHATLVRLTGSTAVTPSPQATQFLADNGVSVEATGPASLADGTFSFPIAAGFGNPETYNGVLAHAGGLRLTKGERSAVLRRFVAVRAGATAVLLAQLPGLPGHCGHVKRALRDYLVAHPGVRRGLWRAAWRYPKAARHFVRSLRRYCRQGRVIVLAQLTNLGKSVEDGTATLTADLALTRRAARIVNRAAGGDVVAAGAPLGSAVSTITRRR